MQHDGLRTLRAPLPPEGRQAKPKPRRRGRVLASLLAVVPVFGVVALGSSGVAYASVDVLPVAPQGIPATIGDIVATNPSWAVTVRGVAAEVTVGATAAAAGAAGVAAAVPAGAVVGAVIGVGTAAYMTWTAGNELGQMLPCWSCSGVVTEHPNKTYSNGLSLSWSQSVVSTPGGPADRLTATVTLPSGYDSSVASGMNAYYAAASGVTPNGYYDSASTSNKYGPTSWTYALSACVSGYNSCGFGQTRYFSGGCVSVYTIAGQMVLRAAYGGVPSGSCTTLVANAAGSTAGQTQAPVSQSGGDGGTTPQPSKLLELVSSAQCRPAAGGALYTVTKKSASFTDGAPIPVVPVPACNGLDTRMSWTVKVHPLDGSFPDKTVIETGTMPTSAPADHPEWAPCMPGGAQHPCTLTLTRVLPDGTTRPYDPATDYKSNPLEQPNTDPESWLCKWGTIRLPVAECSGIYRQPPRASPVPPATSGENCLGGAVSWNPINWVFVPVKCALKWAFVPTEASLQASASRIGGAWNPPTGAKPAPAAAAAFLGGLIVPVTDVFQNTGTANCQGPALDFSVIDIGTIYPLDACTGPMNYARNIVYPLEAFVVLLGAVTIMSSMLLHTIQVAPLLHQAQVRARWMNA